MVGEEQIPVTKYKLEDFLTEKQVHHIIKQYLNDNETGRVVKSDVKRAVDGLAGFLGDHLRATLHVATKDKGMEEIHLFLKHVPLQNLPKADFISDNNYYKREALLFKLIEELQAADDPNPWCARAFVYNESILVMPDLRPQGYVVRPQQETLDLPHVMVTVASVARFHAAIADYEARRTEAGLPSLAQEHAQILEEVTFKDTPYLHCAAKLTANFLNVFSKTYNKIPGLESKLLKLFLEACDSIKEYDNTLNVLLHKDLWVNNIMFRYEQDKPVTALLIDFQCLRYGPPAFDLTIFLHCTTSRSFRKQFQKAIFQYYYAAFLNSLQDSTKQRLLRLGYEEKEFLRWCDAARMFGAVAAMIYFPYILMDPIAAQKTYNDPETFEKYHGEDRTEPVVLYCYQDCIFKDRLLEICEEFVERYVDNLQDRN